MEPGSGQIFFDGRPIRDDLIAYKQRLGYVPEEPHLYGHLSGLEYLIMVGQLRNLPAKPTADRIDGLLRLLALHSDRHAPISAYSKGMRQKVLLTAALMHNPDLLLLDEPFSGLDVGTGLVLRSLIQEMAARGKVVLFSSHELETVERLCSHVVILHRARVVADDSIERLRILMAAPTLEGIFSQLTAERGYGIGLARDRRPDRGVRSLPMMKQQFRVLYREFLFRMVDLELLSSHAQGDMSRLFGQFASLLIFLSLLFTAPALGMSGSRAAAMAGRFEHFLIATTMLVVGLFAVLSWDASFPDRRDVLVLAPLPVRARTIFLAKVAGVAASLGLTVLVLHSVTGLVWPLALNPGGFVGLIRSYAVYGRHARTVRSSSAACSGCKAWRRSSFPASLPAASSWMQLAHSACWSRSIFWSRPGPHGLRPPGSSRFSSSSTDRPLRLRWRTGRGSAWGLPPAWRRSPTR